MTPLSGTPTVRRRPSLLAVAVTDARGRRVAGGTSLAGWLEGAAPRSARGSVSIALVSDVRMRTLNRRYRSVNEATDVLSFLPEPDVPAKERPVVISKSKQNKHLGDIAIAVGVARRQARAYGHTSAIEQRILALHGLLHLLGYDHERDRGEMRTLEERLRRRAGLPVGLIARAPRSAAHR